MSTGSPIGPFAIAMLAAARADATLVSLASGGIFDAVSQHAAKAPPYITLDARDNNPVQSGMQRETGRVSLAFHFWSAVNSPSEVNAMMNRFRQVFERRVLTVFGFAMEHGSLTCEMEQVFPDVDDDMPESKSLYHGVQRWAATLEDAA